LAEAGHAFLTANGDPSVAVDLGAVSNDTATSAGFGCLAPNN
jgi:hypothetical protein